MKDLSDIVAGETTIDGLRKTIIVRAFVQYTFNTSFILELSLHVQEIFKFCHTEKRLPCDIFEKSLKVVSFGCGPGSDLVGFMSFYREKKKQFIKKCVKTLKRYMCTHRCVQHPKRYVVCRKRLLRKIKGKKYRKFQASYERRRRYCKDMFRQMNARVRCTGYDSSSKWRKYLDTLGYLFQRQVICSRFVDAMEPADIAILCYFSHAACLNELNSPAAYSFWRSVKKKFRLVLVVDTTFNDREFNDMLRLRYGFKELSKPFQDENGRPAYTTLWLNLDELKNIWRQ